MQKKTCENGKVQFFLVLAYISKEFAKTQQNVAPPHDGETVTFRNFAPRSQFLI